MLLLVTVSTAVFHGQEADAAKFPGLQWRLIGPFRAGHGVDEVARG